MGVVYAIVESPAGYPVPYEGMCLVSLTRRKQTVGYLLFENRDELARFPAITLSAETRVSISVEGCHHELSKKGQRKAIIKGPLSYNIPGREYTNSLIFDISRATVVDANLK
ncbi:MAG: hypothetical protein ABSF83_01545 [Nitrososphaerales archaeon]|jgi:hypothetical protein